jgi:uncharacterized protein YacL
MSVDFISRLIGMVVFCIIGVFVGSDLGTITQVNQNPAIPLNLEQYTFTFGLVGALVGLILTPYLTTKPVRTIRSKLTRISAQSLFSSFVGLIAGLLTAALLAFPISLLPKPLGTFLPFIGVVVFGYLGITVFSMRSNDLFNVIGGFTGRGASNLPGTPVGDVNANWAENRTILLDTSVIIDGRIADIARTGFFPGSLFIPRFGLN